jgi:hypothetical protein
MTLTVEGCASCTCTGGVHIVVWSAGDTGASDPPEGMPCECGKMVVAYTVCAHCGARAWKLEPREVLS